jgi:hypothetical protein
VPSQSVEGAAASILATFWRLPFAVGGPMEATNENIVELPAGHLQAAPV